MSVSAAFLRNKTMKKRDGINKLQVSIHRLQTDLRSKQRVEFDNIEEHDEEEENPLEWKPPKKGFEPDDIISIRVCNLVAMLGLIFSVVALLFTASKLTTSFAANQARDNTVTTVELCFESGEETLGLAFEAGNEAVTTLAEDMLAQVLQNTTTVMTNFLEANVRRAKATNKFIKDYDVDMSHWEIPGNDWSTSTGLAFLFKYMYSATKAEDLWAFHLMDILKKGDDTQHSQHAYYEPGDTTVDVSRWDPTNVDNVQLQNLTAHYNVDSEGNVDLASKDPNTEIRNTWQNNPDLDVLRALNESTFYWSDIKEWDEAANAIDLSFTYWKAIEITKQNQLILLNTSVGVVTRTVKINKMRQWMEEGLNSIPREAGTEGGRMFYILDSSGCIIDHAPFTAWTDETADDYEVPTTPTGLPKPSACAMPTRDVLGGHSKFQKPLIAGSATRLAEQFQGEKWTALPAGRLVDWEDNDKQYFISTWPIGPGGGTHLNWVLVLVVAASDLNHQVISANEQSKATMGNTRASITADRDIKIADVESKTLANQNIMLIVACVVLVVGLCFGGVINWMITHPIKKMIKVMRSVAYMQLEDADTLAPSQLQEIRNMQACFKQMVHNLKAFKAYMPDYFADLDREVDNQSVGTASQAEQELDQEGLTDEDEDLEAGVDLEGDAGAATIIVNEDEDAPKPKEKVPKPKGTKVGFVDDGSSDQRSRMQDGSSIHSDNRKKKHNSKTMSLALALHQKNATIMIVNMVGFNKMVADRQNNAAEIIQIHSRYLTRVMAAIKKHDGMIDRFVGDKIFAAWGVMANMGKSKSIPIAAQAAKDCVAYVQNGIEGEEDFENIVDYDIQISIGIAHGQVLAGNLGCNDLRGFSVIGNFVNLAYALEKLNKHVGTTILLDATSAAALTYSFGVQPVDRIALDGYLNKQGKPINSEVFELLEPKQQANNDDEDEEWMYRLKNDEDANQGVTIDKAWELFRDGKLDAAEEALETIVEAEGEQEGETVATLMLKRLKGEKEAKILTKKGKYWHHIKLYW